VAANLPVVAFPSKSAWEAWLRKAHETSDGVWLKMARKSSGVDSVTHAEALEVGLCYGWIDGQTKRVDDTHWVQRFTPRTARSKWSKVNREKALELIAAGKMKPAGKREVEAAQADGRWDAAYEPPSKATVPEDLRRALERHPRARRLFEQLDSQNRYAILYRLQDAKRPETRERRLAQFVAMLDEGKTIYPRPSGRMAR
jgi:uncharacterized protein YdeI (YjbR/CyaY-like superfamily)